VSSYPRVGRMTKPWIHIVAGPNGAGKTTFAREFLLLEGHAPVFLNADLIAAGLSPFDPARVAIRAGRIMLQLIDESVAKRESFSFETTLSSRNYATKIPAWRQQGYLVSLHFFSLPSADMAQARVLLRVRQGGHSIPEPVIRRRFESGLRNFEDVYKPAVDRWTHYDSSGVEPIVVTRGGNL
jgi:predicted ABC-type ATPase